MKEGELPYIGEDEREGLRERPIGASHALHMGVENSNWNRFQPIPEGLNDQGMTPVRKIIT